MTAYRLVAVEIPSPHKNGAVLPGDKCFVLDAPPIWWIWKMCTPSPQETLGTCSLALSFTRAMPWTKAACRLERSAKKTCCKPSVVLCNNSHLPHWSFSGWEQLPCLSDHITLVTVCVGVQGKWFQSSNTTTGKGSLTLTEEKKHTKTMLIKLKPDISSHDLSSCWRLICSCLPTVAKHVSVLEKLRVARVNILFWWCNRVCWGCFWVHNHGQAYVRHYFKTQCGGLCRHIAMTGIPRMPGFFCCVLEQKKKKNLFEIFLSNWQCHIFNMKQI